MFVLVESLLTKSKVLARQESLGKCLKVESRFYKRPILSVLLCSRRKANCTFRSRIQRLYRNIAGFCTCGEFVNSGFNLLWFILNSPSFQRLLLKTFRFYCLMNLHQVRP